MAEVTLKDTSLKDYDLDKLPRLKLLREHFMPPGKKKPEICIERARLVTEYLRRFDDPIDGPELRQAKKVRHFLRHKKPVFHDVNLLAGSTTSKPFGAPLFPEFMALTLWPELETISTRAKNPMLLSPEDAEILNSEIFPFWRERNVLELTRKHFGETRCLDLFEQIVFFISGKAGTLSHTVPTYKLMLEKGLQWIWQIAQEKEERHTRANTNGASRQKASFYQAVRISLEGIMEYAERLAAHAEKLAGIVTDPDAKKELRDMAAVCRRVPAHHATSFREAVSAIWICQIGILAENSNMSMSPGRLDQVLYPYYRKDMKSGELDVAKALELVGCLWFKLSDNVVMVPEASEELFGGAGTAPAVTLGGVDSKGEDAVNDLTYIMLRVTELLRIRDPNVNARFHFEKNPPEYLERVSHVILNTQAVPAIYNDVANIAALEGQKEKTEHARDYAIVGCVELSSSGRDYGAESSIMLNLVAPFEMALFGGKRPITGDDQINSETSDPGQAGLKRFEEFRDIFFKQLDWLIGQAVEMNENFGLVHQEMMPSPLLSAFFKGPLEKGLDLIRGGAIYNSSGATHIGFPDVVDSLNAIENAVFVNPKYTFAGLLEALKSDFKGPEGKKMREWLERKSPRYGTDHPKALKNSKDLARHLFQTYQKYINYRGGPYRPAYWTMTNHAGLGGVCGALPYGRKEYEALSSGITPVSGAAPVLTACLNAVASLGGPDVPGGWALNLKYTPPDKGASEQEKDIMAKCFAKKVEAFFRSGGQQIQFNIMTYQMLNDAKLNPQNYPELMVRVSGYSAYFNDLNEMMKDELITRTQYDLQSGQAVPLPAAIRTQTTQSTGGIADLVRAELRKLLHMFRKKVRSSVAEHFLAILLELMEGVYRLPLKYKDNIRDFEGKYQFRSEKGGIMDAVEFHKGKMRVLRHTRLKDPNVTIIFRDGDSLMNLLLAPKQDVLDDMLHHNVRTKGNVNYLFQFAYMVRQLLLPKL